MSTLRETSDSYLNLKSEQFNSWVNEFENKYNNLEDKNFKNSEENLSDIIEDNQSIEEDSDTISIVDTNSENMSSSNIFINRDKSAESSSTNRRVFLGRTSIRRSRNINLSESNSSEKKIEEKKTQKQKLDINCCKSDNKEDKIENDNIISLSQLNSMIPNLDRIISESKLSEKKSKKKEKKNIVVPTNDNTVVKNRAYLGEQALYRFITNRRR